MSDENKEILPDVKNIKTTETFTLPSKGLLYKPEENIPASITLRRMTTKEDKIRMRNQSEDRIRKDILQACILNEGVDAGKLKLVDANFLLFRLRQISLLDDKYKVGCYCTSCASEFVHELNLSEVPINYYEKDNLQNLEVTLPMCGAKVSLKYPSLNDMIARGQDLKDLYERFPDVDKSEALYTMVGIVYIDAINGKHCLAAEVEAFLDNLDIIDNRAYREAIAKLDDAYGFVQDIKTECPSCHKEVTHGLPITSELFSPSK